MVVQYLYASRGCWPAPLSSTRQPSRTRNSWIRRYYPCSTILGSQPADDKNKVYKQVGLFSVRKKIEDAVLRAEMLASKALEVEESTLCKREEIVRQHNLWEDPVKSSEILSKLAGSANLVDSLKDVMYKAEEAKLITQLAESKGINQGLFKQAYDASVNVCGFLDQYEMSKLLKGPYDVEGACVIIRAGSKSIYSEIWAEQLLCMYNKWAEKHGYRGRVVEKCCLKAGGFTSATVEFEYGYIYGYLLGERGVHSLISHQNGSPAHVTALADVDVIPLFLEMADLQIDEKDLLISSSAPSREETDEKKLAVCIQHIPTGISVQSSGERSHFANRMKALNRLKSKLLVIAKEQGVYGVNKIRRDAIHDVQYQQTRRYIFEPYKQVHDVKTGIQLSDLTSILDGNIEPLLEAHVGLRQEVT